MMKRLLLILLFATTAGAQTLATVNEEELTVRDLLEQFNSRHSGHSKFLGGDVEARKFLNILIDDLLLTQEGYNLGIDADPEVVRYVTDFESTRVGNYFVDQEITKKAATTPEEVKEIWEKSLGFVLHARQIVVSSKQEAEEIRRAIIGGADFESLARSCSLADSRLRGGHIMATWGTFGPEWEAVVFPVEPGDLAPVVETANGFEVVLVMNRVDVPKPEFEKVKKEIEDALYQRKLEGRKKAIAEMLWSKYQVNLLVKDISPETLAKLGPAAVVATWSDGGRLTVGEAFEAADVVPYFSMEPAKAKKEITDRIKASINSPLVIREGRERGMQNAEAVKVEVDRYRDYVVESILFRDHIFKKLEPADSELEAYYEANKKNFVVGEQRRVAQILTRTEAEAKAAYDKVAKGAEFADVAKELSRDMVTATKGGDLGWVFSDNVPSAFAEVKKIAAGKVLKPVKTDAGWHVIKLLEIKAPSQPPFAEVKDKVLAQALDEQKRKARTFWVEKLRGASKIQIDDAAIAAFVKANEFSGQAPPQHAVQ